MDDLTHLAIIASHGRDALETRAESATSEGAWTRSEEGNQSREDLRESGGALSVGHAVQAIEGGPQINIETIDLQGTCGRFVEEKLRQERRDGVKQRLNMRRVNVLVLQTAEREAETGQGVERSV
jgi:hypothetical protein